MFILYIKNSTNMPHCLHKNDMIYMLFIIVSFIDVKNELNKWIFLS